MASAKNIARRPKRSWLVRATLLAGVGALTALAYACQQPSPTVPQVPPPEPPGQCPEAPEPPPISTECLLWYRTQEPLAALALEALKLGRIDPGIFKLDPLTGKLRSTLPGENAGLNRALNQVNDQLVLRDALETAYRRVSAPDQLGKCPAKTYAAKVWPDPKVPASTQRYRWEFTGDKPSEEQLGCFQALYGTPPPACRVAPSLYAKSDCLQLKGLNPDELEQSAEARTSGAPSDAVESLAPPASASASGCRKKCDICDSTYKYHSVCGDC